RVRAAPPRVHLTSASHYGAGDLRQLQSFPTRRSSDLPVMVGEKGGRKTPAFVKESLHHVGQQAEETGALDRLGEFALLLLADGGDRKSTRLNSSHVKISYAVFCLKKKLVKRVRRISAD